MEIKLKDNEDRKSGESRPMGQLVVSGPAVVGGQVVADHIMAMTDENTLTYP